LPVIFVGVAKVLLKSWYMRREPITVTLSDGSAVSADATITGAEASLDTGGGSTDRGAGLATSLSAWRAPRGAPSRGFTDALRPT